MDHNPSEQLCPANNKTASLFITIARERGEGDITDEFCECSLIRAARQPLLDAVDAAIDGWEYPADGPRNYSESISSALAPYRNQGDPK